jgi:hypothetical protein
MADRQGSAPAAERRNLFADGSVCRSEPEGLIDRETT